MAEAFLRQLLRVENSVQPTGSERCIICLTECGTLCPETGVVEWEIRLPCKHSVGSRCIATWMNPKGTASNSCPVCRHVFFPAQPRPYLEHGVFEDDQDGRVDSGPSDVPERVSDDAVDPPYEDYAPSPYAGSAISGDTRVANGEGSFLDSGGGYTGYNIPDSPAEATIIRRTVRLQGLAPGEIESIVRANLPHRPARQQRTTQDEESVRDEHSPVRDTSHFDLTNVNTMCETYCCRLNLTSSFRVIDVSQRLAAKIYMPCTIAFYSPGCIAAVSVYIASHLAGTPKTVSWVSANSGVGADAISSLYRCIDPVRSCTWLIDEEMLAASDRGRLETVLRSLPQGFLPEA